MTSYPPITAHLGEDGHQDVCAGSVAGHLRHEGGHHGDDEADQERVQLLEPLQLHHHVLGQPGLARDVGQGEPAAQQQDHAPRQLLLNWAKVGVRARYKLGLLCPGHLCASPAARARSGPS